MEPTSLPELGDPVAAPASSPAPDGEGHTRRNFIRGIAVTGIKG